MKIAFVYDHYSFGDRTPIDFADLHGQGLTGTDLIATMYPIHMAGRGYEVSSFVDRATGGVYDAVRVHPASEWTASVAQDFDVVITASNPNALKLCLPRTLRAVNRQVSLFGIDCEKGWQEWTDLVLCPSQTAKRIVGAPCRYPERFDVLPNGVDVRMYPANPAKVPGRCVYISSPDRGLHWVLDAWPQIRAAIPYATLKVFYYSLRPWLKYHTDPNKRQHDEADAECSRRAMYIEYALRRLEGVEGVEIVGGISHRDLAHELSQAELLLYPCDTIKYTETFGVAVLEAMAAGCVPVLSRADSFGELWGSSCPSVDEPMKDHVHEWTTLAIDLLRDSNLRAQWVRKGYEHALRFDWSNVARDMESLFQGLERKPACQETRPLMLHAILTIYGSGETPMDPKDPELACGGGSRRGFVLLTRALAKLGVRVRAFSNWTRECTWEGVDHLPLDESADYGEPDVLLAYYDTTPLLVLPAKMLVASHHTYNLPSPGSVQAADINTAPSEGAARVLSACFGGKHWTVVPNIAPTDLPEWKPVQGRVLYHTSPDRGLALLIMEWPEIRRRVPEATLHVVGDVQGWISWALGSMERGSAERAEMLRDALPAAEEAGGLELLGVLSRQDLLQELSEASVFAFPADPPAPCETFSVSVLECLAMGMPVVLSPCDALGELWRDVAFMVNAPAREFMADFVDALVGVISSSPSTVMRAKAAARRFTAENAARALLARIHEVLLRGSNLRAQWVRKGYEHALRFDWSNVRDVPPLQKVSP